MESAEAKTASPVGGLGGTLAEERSGRGSVGKGRARVGVLGASGYAGAELLRLCAGHPSMDVVLAGAESQAGTPVGQLYPSLSLAYPELSFERATPDELSDLDLLFLALPHGTAARMMRELAARVDSIVDLSADFRLRDASAYSAWYGAEHPAPELLASFSCGLPELFRMEVASSHLVAVPGCYVTAAALALAPLVRVGMIETKGVLVDAASGVSGAGRGAARDTQFAELDESFTAYSLLRHRHTPEMEQATGAEVLFTPHLAPMSRGILATCYARPARPTTTEELLGTLASSYGGEPFIQVSESPPATKATLGSNSAHLTARHDTRTGWVVVLCALDNLLKGASGQAMQCANLLLGFPEEAGLSRAAVYP